MPGSVAADFDPVGGHWGIDFSAPVGTEVRAAGPGSVTFAGSVGEMLSVTIAHGAGLRTSYSFLSTITVAKGEAVTAGDVVGTSGIDRGRPALHLSLRRDDMYLDPAPWLRCASTVGELYLLPGLGVAARRYAARRATRHHRRHVRPHPHRPPGGR